MNEATGPARSLTDSLQHVIDGTHLGAEPAAAAAGGGGANPLPQFMQHQLQDNWCWAAVGTSIGLLFQTGSWTQCDTASACLQGNPACCSNPVPCNVYGYVNKSLTYTKSLQTYGQGVASPSRIQSEIDAGHPVCVRIAWFPLSSGAAHFMCVTGYSGDGANMHITTQDSIYGTSAMALSNFPAKYQSGGQWSWTFYTEKH